MLNLAFSERIFFRQNRDEYWQKEIVAPLKNYPRTPVTVSSVNITNIYSKIMSKVQLRDFDLVGCRQFSLPVAGEALLSIFNLLSISRRCSGSTRASNEPSRILKIYNFTNKGYK